MPEHTVRVLSNRLVCLWDKYPWLQTSKTCTASSEVLLAERQEPSFAARTEFIGPCQAGHRHKPKDATFPSLESCPPINTAYLIDVIDQIQASGGNGLGSTRKSRPTGSGYDYFSASRALCQAPIDMFHRKSLSCHSCRGTTC